MPYPYGQYIVCCGSRCGSISPLPPPGLAFFIFHCPLYCDLRCCVMCCVQLHTACGACGTHFEADPTVRGARAPPPSGSKFSRCWRRSGAIADWRRSRQAQGPQARIYSGAVGTQLAYPPESSARGPWCTATAALPLAHVAVRPVAVTSVRARRGEMRQKRKNETLFFHYKQTELHKAKRIKHLRSCTYLCARQQQHRAHQSRVSRTTKQRELHSTHPSPQHRGCHRLTRPSTPAPRATGRPAACRRSSPPRCSTSRPASCASARSCTGPTGPARR